MGGAADVDTFTPTTTPSNTPTNQASTLTFTQTPTFTRKNTNTWTFGAAQHPVDVGHTFNTGRTTYPYFCTVHGGVMIGTVIVNPAPAPARR